MRRVLNLEITRCKHNVILKRKKYSSHFSLVIFYVTIWQSFNVKIISIVTNKSFIELETFLIHFHNTSTFPVSLKIDQPV